MKRRALLGLGLGIGLCLASVPALAQGFNMGGGSGQIEVSADQGLEWSPEAKRVSAKGNALATRGPVRVAADQLVAHYRETDGSEEIYRLEAIGNVVITSTNEKAVGDSATYDLDKSVVVLRGSAVSLVTPQEKITATESIEYWDTKHTAVARGNAVATQGGRTLKADVLQAQFMPEGKKGKSGSKTDQALALQKADAFGNVELTTNTETLTGQRADYNAQSGVATVSGSVKITRPGGNQLTGGYAHVNLRTGISKLFGAAPGGGEGRVRGVFTPEKDQGSNRSIFGTPN